MNADIRGHNSYLALLVGQGVSSMICTKLWLFRFLVIVLGIMSHKLVLFWQTWNKGKTKDNESTGAVLQICEYQKKIVENGHWN